MYKCLFLPAVMDMVGWLQTICGCPGRVAALRTRFGRWSPLILLSLCQTLTNVVLQVLGLTKKDEEAGEPEERRRLNEEYGLEVLQDDDVPDIVVHGRHRVHH